MKAVALETEIAITSDLFVCQFQKFLIGHPRHSGANGISSSMSGLPPATAILRFGLTLASDSVGVGLVGSGELAGLSLPLSVGDVMFNGGG